MRSKEEIIKDYQQLRDGKYDEFQVKHMMDEYASQFGYSRKQMEDCWDAAIKSDRHNDYKGTDFEEMVDSVPDKETYFASLPEPSHLHSTDQVLKIAGEAWENYVVPFVSNEVRDYFLTQLKSQLKK